MESDWRNKWVVYSVGWFVVWLQTDLFSLFPPPPPRATSMWHSFLPQVQTLQEALSAAKSANNSSRASAAADTTGTGAATTSAAAAVGLTAAVTAAAVDTSDRRGSSSGSSREVVGAGGKSDSEQTAAVAHMAKELEQAQKELNNLREREKDARGEADRVAASAERVRCGLLLLRWHIGWSRSHPHCSDHQSHSAERATRTSLILHDKAFVRTACLFRVL